MLEKIRQLEALARQLEPDAARRETLRDDVMGYSESFLRNIDALKAYEENKHPAKAIFESGFGEQPGDIGPILELIRDSVDTPGLNPASGGHLGYIPGGGLYAASLGDYLAAVSNRYAGIHFASPGAVNIENLCLRWMAGIVGYPADAGGNLASGGSIANLVAIVTARDAFGAPARDFENMVIYLGAQAHHCIDKAIRIAGLNECEKRFIPLDERYRMIPAKLEEAIQRDKESGLRPFLVIASAGTSDLGTIDPLEDIGRIAKSHDLWFHVDGAYGAFFTLVDDCRPKLRGMDLSDSIVMDPHKGLFLPYGLGAVLVKDREALHRSHHYQANYMQDVVANPESASPSELSPELTKHFRGLRMWLPLKLHGLAPFRACLEEKLCLARYFREEVMKLGFESPVEPELSVVGYRFVPPSGDANAFNEKLIQACHRDGRVFISSTLLDGQFTLRFAALAFRTHKDTVDTLLEMLATYRDQLLDS